MERRNERILKKIMEEAETLQSFIRDVTEQEFYRSEVIRRAASMTLINIGELVKSLDETLRLSYPDVPWRAIAGLRDIAAHKYYTLNMQDIWVTICDDIPSLYERISNILCDNKK